MLFVYYTLLLFPKLGIIFSFLLFNVIFIDFFKRWKKRADFSTGASEQKMCNIYEIIGQKS